MTDPADDGGDSSRPADGGGARRKADDDGPQSALHVATEGESWTGPDDRTLEPGSPSLEHALFVALGAAATLLVLGQFLL